MKTKIILLLAFISTVLINSAVYAHDEECEIVQVRTGTYASQCPSGQVSTGGYVNHFGNFTYSYFYCAKMNLMCGQELRDFKNELVIQQDLQSTN